MFRFGTHLVVLVAMFRFGTHLVVLVAVCKVFFVLVEVKYLVTRCVVVTDTRLVMMETLATLGKSLHLVGMFCNMDPITFLPGILAYLADILKLLLLGRYILSDTPVTSANLIEDIRLIS
jgi:hypothetical protein